MFFLMRELLLLLFFLGAVLGDVCGASGGKKVTAGKPPATGLYKGTIQTKQNVYTIKSLTDPLDVTDDTLAKFVNIGNLTLYESTLTTNVVDPDLGFTGFGGNPIGMVGAKLTDTSENYTFCTGNFQPDDGQVRPDEGSQFNASGGIGLMVVSQGISSYVGDLTRGRGLRSLRVRSPHRDNPYVDVGLLLGGPDALMSLSITSAASCIDLNGGTVYLNRDLPFCDDARFINVGVVNLNGKSVIFGGEDRVWDTDIVWSSPGTIEFNSKVTVDGRWYFDGGGITHLLCNGNILDLTNGGTLWIRSGTTLYLSDLVLKGLGIGRIAFEDKTSQLYLSNVTLELDRNYTITTGGIYIEGPSMVMAKNRTLTFDTNASLTVDGVTLWYDTTSYPDINNIQPLQTSAANSGNKFVTFMHDGYVQPAANGAFLRTTSNAVNYGSVDQTTRNAIRTTSNSLCALDAKMRIDSNTVAYNFRINSNVEVRLLHEIEVIEVPDGEGGELLLGRIDQVEAKVRANSQAINYYAPTVRNNSYWLRVNSNAMSMYAAIVRNSSYILRGTSLAINYYAPTVRNNSYWLRVNSQAITKIVDRFDDLFGSAPVVIIDPAVFLSGDYWLTDGHTLHIQLTGDDTTCNIDGGGHAMWFIRGGQDLIVVDDGMKLILTNIVLKNFDYRAIQLGDGASIIFGDGCVVELAENQTLWGSWTFAGNALLNGVGNKLSLATRSGHYRNGIVNIEVLQPGTLTIQDTILDGVEYNNVRCVGNNATLNIRNCDLILSNNYSFTCGSINFEQDVLVKGPYKFSYESGVQSTIVPNSTLFFDLGTSFSYAPSANNRGLIAMEDETSKIFLNGCTLYSTTTGLRLTKGTLIVDHKNNLYADGSKLSQAISFGNGNTDDNLTIQVMPGASLDVKRGCLNYANVNE